MSGSNIFVTRPGLNDERESDHQELAKTDGNVKQLKINTDDICVTQEGVIMEVFI